MKLGHARGETGDYFSSAAAVSLGATAGAAAAEATVESVVSAAEAPTHIVERTVVRAMAVETTTTTRAAAPKPPQWGQMSQSAKMRWYRRKGPSV